MKNKKRVVIKKFLLMGFCTSLILASLFAACGENSTIDNSIENKKTESLGLEYALNEDNNSYSVVGVGICQDTDIVIPAKYNDKDVTSISSNAFNGCTNITSIVIPENVTSIGEDAFYDTEYYNNEENWENDALYIGKYLIF